MEMVFTLQTSNQTFPGSKVRGANMGPTWGRQDPGGPHGGPMNLAIWVILEWEYENFEGTFFLWGLICDNSEFAEIIVL